MPSLRLNMVSGVSSGLTGACQLHHSHTLGGPSLRKLSAACVIFQFQAEFKPASYPSKVVMLTWSALELKPTGYCTPQL
eukprot:6480200-Amphidinium_carterae.1